jgi:predicted NodU family carbamoyl transferase
MNVLGVTAFRGPSAACLLRDGLVVAAAREDRFTRRSGEDDFPSASIAYCLRAGKLGPTDVSGVAFVGTPDLPTHRRDLPYSVSRDPTTLKERLGRWLGRKPSIADLVAEDLDKLTPIRFVEPERAHAAGAYYTSPLPDAAVLVVQEGGDENASLWRGRGAALDRVRSFGTSPERVADLVRSLPDETEADALALGGAAVADRSVVGAVRRAGAFPDVWIHPAAAGGADAIGAALDVWLRSGAPGSDVARKLGRSGAGPGPGYNAHQIRTFLRSREARSTEVARGEHAPRVAALLAEGLTLGWFAGRLDLAEDTAATRSVLRRPSPGAPPTPFESLAVPADRASEFLEFEVGESAAFVEAKVRERSRENLGLPPSSSRFHAVSLVDRDAHPDLHAVLDALDRQGMTPIVAACALAREGEPVACTPEDAYDAWVDLGLDALLLGPYLLERSGRTADAAAVTDSP